MAGEDSSGNTVLLAIYSALLGTGLAEKKNFLPLFQIHVFEDLLCKPTVGRPGVTEGKGKKVSFSLQHTMAVVASIHQHGYKGGFHFVAAPTSERNLCVWRNLVFSIKNNR